MRWWLAKCDKMPAMETQKKLLSMREKVAYLKPTLWGVLMYHCLPIRRGVVLSNMRLALGEELSEAEIKKLAQCFYSHLMRVFLRT